LICVHFFTYIKLKGKRAAEKKLDENSQIKIQFTEWSKNDKIQFYKVISENVILKQITHFKISLLSIAFKKTLTSCKKT